MGRTLENSMAEKEANDIAFKFMNSNDVVKDMSEAYNVDFSGINFHSDASADSKVKAEGKDAIASGKDIFFGKGILESNDAASKGLVAHELAHTMQQGVVESSGVVSESVSEGAEQGGLRDWFRNLFGMRPKYKFVGGEKSTDEASLNYMAAMRAKEDEILRNKRKGAVDSLGKLSGEKISDEEINKMNTLNPSATKSSNADFATKMKGGNLDTAIASALVEFGHRNTSTDVGSNDRDIRKKVFSGSINAYRKYMENMDASGTDFVRIDNEMQQYTAGQNSGFATKQYKYGSGVNGMIGDVVDIIGQYLSSDVGLEYVSNMHEGIKDADVFKTGKVTPMSYILQTALTGEGLKMTGSMRDGQFTQGGKQEESRGNVITAMGRGLMTLPLIDRMSEEQIKLLPQATQDLYKKYKELERQLEEQIGKR